MFREKGEKGAEVGPVGLDRGRRAALFLRQPAEPRVDPA
jgi:hypothetical protein